jgi:D-cysteine desulfhydrase
METLASEISVGELLVKRDDQSAEVYGGNKVRKLEFLLGKALAGGYKAVLTYGSAGSNHALATAIYARQLGLVCHAILTPEPATPKIAEKLRCHVQLETRLEAANTREQIRAARARIMGAGDVGSSIYEIPFGGSSWRGVVGFVNAALELADQVDAGVLGPPDLIYVAGGTEGSAAGLCLGLRLVGLPVRIHEVRVTPDAMASPDLFARLFTETASELHDRDASFDPPDEPLQQVKLRREFLGGGYAVPTPEANSAIELVERAEGISLETTYTGKAMAALIADGRAGQLATKRVLFWNTYNSRPLPDTDPDISASDLPAEFGRYFES